MKQIDELTQGAAAAPGDEAARRVLSDCLRAHEDHDLADAVEAPGTGAALLAETAAVAAAVRLPVSARLLWAVYALLPRLRPGGPALGAAGFRGLQEWIAVTRGDGALPRGPLRGPGPVPPVQRPECVRDDGHYTYTVGTTAGADHYTR